LDLCGCYGGVDGCYADRGEVAVEDGQTLRGRNFFGFQVPVRFVGSFVGGYGPLRDPRCTKNTIYIDIIAYISIMYTF
jgi:hypothetical protein